MGVWISVLPRGEEFAHQKIARVLPRGGGGGDGQAWN